MIQSIFSRKTFIRITEIFFAADDTMKQGQIFELYRKCPRQNNCLVCVYSGTAKYYFENEEVIVKPGDLISLQDPYYFEVLSETYHYGYVYFDIQKDDSVYLKNAVYRLNNAKSIQMNMEKLVSLSFYKKPGYYLKMAVLIYDMLYQIISNEFSNSHLNDKYRKIEPSLQYLSTHFTDRSLSIEQAATLSGLSERQFRRIFKELYSMTPCRYLTLLQIDRAKELLSNPYRTVAEAAEQTGYSDVYYFSKQFKAETGETPTQYRKNHQFLSTRR